MASAVKLTVADLEALPENGKRYELIEGELYVSTQPHWLHQRVCGELFTVLNIWSKQTGRGVAGWAPGIIFSEEDAVAPDIIWVSKDRLNVIDLETGKLHRAPDLIVEVLSPGPENERRDRRTKLHLYSRHGVKEYWIVDWQTKIIEVYRRKGTSLRLNCTLREEDDLTSPLLPGFSVKVEELFR